MGGGILICTRKGSRLDSYGLMKVGGWNWRIKQGKEGKRGIREGIRRWTAKAKVHLRRCMKS